MTPTTDPKVTDIEEASTAKWLALTLAPARACIRQAPREESVSRIRAMVFGETAPHKTRRPKAA